MTKLSRSVLKEIVKECIVEIFQESFFHDNPIMMEEKKPRNTRQKRPNVSNSRRVSNNSNRSSLDTVSFGSRQEISENRSFDKKIDSITSNMTSDPVFADIFKDTARTTLQSQISAESGRGSSYVAKPGADKASILASQSDPSELFSESANKWAALAFADSINKWEKNTSC